MVEQNQVVDNMPLDYEGVFSVTELHKAITDWLEENKYSKKEIKHHESVTAEGKNISFRLECKHKVNDYMDRVIILKANLSKIKSTTVERSGKKVSLQTGVVDIKFHGFIYTDLEQRWELKPSYAIIRDILDRYVYGSFTGGPKGAIAKDVTSLHKRIDSFLQLYRY